MTGCIEDAEVSTVAGGAGRRGVTCAAGVEATRADSADIEVRGNAGTPVGR